MQELADWLLNNKTAAFLIAVAVSFVVLTVLDVP